MENNKAMKRWLYIGVVLSASFSTGWISGCSSRISRPIAGEQELNESEQAGEKIYMQHCQRCHPQGEAGLGPSIHWAPGFAKRFQVRHGAGAMPEFNEDHISEKEMDHLMNYLEAVKEK